MEEQVANPTPATPPASEVVQTPVLPHSSKKMYWVIGAVVVILVIVGGVGYMLMKQTAATQPSTSTYHYTSPTPTTVPTSASQASTGSVGKTGTSNQQLGTDLQTVQGNLNQLTTDQNGADQAIQNQSQDTQQQ